MDIIMLLEETAALKCSVAVKVFLCETYEKSFSIPFTMGPQMNFILARSHMLAANVNRLWVENQVC